MLAIRAVPCCCTCALAFDSNSTSAAAPGLARPMALISPCPQSRQVGLTCPARGSGPQLLAVTAPQPAAAARSSRLAVVPQMPLARTSGVASAEKRLRNAMERSDQVFWPSRLLMGHTPSLQIGRLRLASPRAATVSWRHHASPTAQKRQHFLALGGVQQAGAARTSSTAVSLKTLCAVMPACASFSTPPCWRSIRTITCSTMRPAARRACRLDRAAAAGDQVLDDHHALALLPGAFDQLAQAVALDLFALVDQRLVRRHRHRRADGQRRVGHAGNAVARQLGQQGGVGRGGLGQQRGPADQQPQVDINRRLDAAGQRESAKLDRAQVEQVGSKLGAASCLGGGDACGGGGSLRAAGAAPAPVEPQLMSSRSACAASRWSAARQCCGWR